MYEIEMLDRSLVSLQKTEDAYMEINNRIINSVNQRKIRLNDLNNRILGLSSKILSLQNMNQPMRIQSSGFYPQISTSTSAKHNP